MWVPGFDPRFSTLPPPYVYVWPFIYRKKIGLDEESTMQRRLK